MTDVDPAPAASKRHMNAPVASIVASLRGWWSGEVTKDINHSAVLLKIAEESAMTPRYIFMTCMSAGIAILGMLLSSPAVVIGAMLLSPLMGPILGAGFALAEGKWTWLRISAQAILWGTLFAVLFCAAVVFLSPLQTVTEEIAARTRPNLFDLLVALFSSLAGSYAMIRGRLGTIVGVAIATALMPPLAAVGFGLATLNMAVFGGALLLYVTNLLTIALTATLMARLYGFRYNRSTQHGLRESLVILGTFIALAIPLAFSLSQIAREANGQRIVNAAIADAFDPRAQVEQPVIDWDGDPIRVTATVFTPKFRSDANDVIAASLRDTLGDEVVVSVGQFQVGADPGAAEQAALAAARDQQQAEAAERQIGAMTDRLALVAGVDISDVTIDRQNKRALVRATPLDGLPLAGYRALEQRVARQATDWTVELRPPLLALPDVPLDDGAIGDASTPSVELLRWAASRTDVPVRLTGPREPVEALAADLANDGIEAEAVPGGGSVIRTEWQTGQ